MKRLILATLLLACCIVPAMALQYANYSVYGTSRTDILIGENATIALGVFNDGSNHFDAQCEQICSGTGNHRNFWYAEWQPSSSYRGYSKCSPDYSGNCQSMPAFSGMNYTNGDPNWDANLTAQLVCSNDGTNVDTIAVRKFNVLSEAPIVSANFTATPTGGVGPIYIPFTDTSLNATAWNWSITPATGWMAAPQDMDNEDLVVLFNTNGNYTVSHGVSNSWNSDIETKTDYIWIYNSTSTATTGVFAVDIISGSKIHDAEIDIYDIENASWTNSTGTGGLGYITTLIGHHLNAYASAPGYDSNSLLNFDSWGGGFYSVNLMPTGFTSVSAGNVTLYVTVVDYATQAPISSAGVSIAKAGGATWTAMTNAAGIASFTVTNNTIYYVTASKAGYVSLSQSKNSGTGSGGSASVDMRFELQRASVTTAPTTAVTTLPGGGTPTPTTTVDPYTLLSPEEKQLSLANDALEYGPMLIQLFMLLIIVGAVKMLGK